MAKSKPFSAKFQFDKISNGFSQRRSISSTQSDPLGSDAVPVVSTVNSPFQGSTPIDAGSSIRKPISLWHKMYHSPVTNALWEARSKFFEKSSNGSENGNAQSELIVKNPSESRTSISYKFSSDYILREQYRNPWNEIKMGKLLEDLDALAGTISFKIVEDGYQWRNYEEKVTRSQPSPNAYFKCSFAPTSSVKKKVIKVHFCDEAAAAPGAPPGWPPPPPEASTAHGGHISRHN